MEPTETSAGLLMRRGRDISAAASRMAFLLPQPTIDNTGRRLLASSATGRAILRNSGNVGKSLAQCDPDSSMAMTTPLPLEKGLEKDTPERRKED